MLKSVSCLLSILIVGSCHWKAVEEKPLFKVELNKVKDFKIEAPLEANSFMNAFFLNDDENFLIQTNYTNAFFIYDLENKELAEKIEIEDFLYDKIGTVGHINSPEFKYLIPSSVPNGLVGYRNDSGVEIMKIPVDKYRLTDANRKTKPIYLGDEKVLIHLHTGNFAMFKGADKPESANIWGVFDLKTKELVHQFGSYPSSIFNGFELPMEFTIPFYTVAGNKLYCSFPLEEEIQIYDLETYAQETVNVKSKHFKTPQANLDLEDKTAQFKFFLYSNKFSSLNYHKEKELFSRILVHQLNENATDVCNRGFSVQIFDKEFNFLTELDLLGYSIDWNYAIATSKGFVTSSMCEEFVGEDYLVFNAEYELAF